MGDSQKSDQQIDTFNWDEDDWDALVDTIHKGECVLMLGPDVAIPDEENKPLGRQLANELAGWLRDHLASNEYKKINPENLPQVAQLYQYARNGENFPKLRAKKFYQARRKITSQLHKNLAVLPFRFIVTSTHDEMMVRALEKMKKKPIVDWYHFKGDMHDMVETGDIKNPLVYYLCGSIDQKESLVLTDNDLLDFLAGVIKGNPGLPENVISVFRAEHINYLFLGFGFKNWYLRILMHVLEKSKKHRSIALEQASPKNQKEFDSTVLFFKRSRHNIHIFRNELNTFTNELIKKYTEKYSGSNTSLKEVKFRPYAPVAFISHISANRDVAAKLYDQLETNGIKPWLDRKNLEGGDLFDSVIKKAIEEEIDYFILINSKDLTSANETYVMEELGEALRRQVKFRSHLRFIIPVTIDDAPEFEELKKINHINLPDLNDIGRLVSTINKDQERRKKKD